MKYWPSFLLVLLLCFSPALASEPAHDTLPPELVRLRDEGRLTVRALWAWQLVSELTPAMFLEFKNLGHNLLDANEAQLRTWLAQNDTGQGSFSETQCHLLRTLLAWMESSPENLPVFAQDRPIAAPADPTAILAPQEIIRPATDAFYRGTLARTGVFPGPIPQQAPTLLWKLELSTEDCRDPVVAGESAYIGSVDGQLYAIDLTRGALRWKFDAEDWIDLAPAISAGMVYFGRIMGNTDRKGQLFAVDALTGSLVWKFESPIYGIASSPAIVDDTVYFGAGDGHLYALAAQTGTMTWNFKRNTSSGSSRVGTPAIVGPTVYFTHDNYLTAVDVGADEEKWTFMAQTKINTCPVVADDLVYCGADDDFHLYAVDRHLGQEKWKFNIGRIVSPPAVHGDMVYAASFDNLHALNAQTGAILWTVNSKQKSLTAPVIVDDTIIIGAREFLLALDRVSGQEKWRFEAGGKITTPAVADGVIYFWSDDGYFYAVH